MGLSTTRAEVVIRAEEIPVRQRGVTGADIFSLNHRQEEDEEIYTDVLIQCSQSALWVIQKAHL